jgi:hypothetical protein
MAQLNLHMTPDFNKDLKAFMKLRKLKHKSQALRLALQEALEREKEKKKIPNIKSWIGMALGKGFNPNPRFLSEDDLWETKK